VLNHTVFLGAVRRNKFLLQTVAANQCYVFPAGKKQPISLRSRNYLSNFPKVPNLLINACSSTLALIVALPERDSRNPGISRVWQSIARVKVVPTRRGTDQ
jgi:hypothetical protein